jgi:TatA/E family protein of Tat protein translocase
MLLLFVFEFLGTTELMVILVVALVLFGPRKLPELGRSLGKSLAEFKRATDDFKNTWEREVELDKIERDMRIEHAIHDNPTVQPDEPYAPPPLLETDAAPPVNGEDVERTIARQANAPAASPVDSQADDATTTVAPAATLEPALEPERGRQ